MDELIWAVIRQDDNGNRYRVGCYETREEAELIAERFEARGHKQAYLVERIDRQQAS
jgi:cell division protein FtsN